MAPPRKLPSGRPTSSTPSSSFPEPSSQRKDTTTTSSPPTARPPPPPPPPPPSSSVPEPFASHPKDAISTDSPPTARPPPTPPSSSFPGPFASHPKDTTTSSPPTAARPPPPSFPEPKVSPRKDTTSTGSPPTTGLPAGRAPIMSHKTSTESLTAGLPAGRAPVMSHNTSTVSLTAGLPADTVPIISHSTGSLPSGGQHAVPASDHKRTESSSSSPARGLNQGPKLVNSPKTTSFSADHMAPTLLDLVNVGNDDLGATGTVKYLLQAVGRDIMSLQRNTNVSYMVAERARDIVMAINDCIIKVESSETEDWESFDKFSNAIEPLEDVLFRLLTFADEEKGQYVAETSSTNACVSSPESWATRRKEIFEILDVFYTSEVLVDLLSVPDTQTRERNHNDAQFHDDKTLIEVMRAKINAVLFNGPTKFPTYVYDIEIPLDKLQNTVISSSPRPPAWLAVLTIQTSMLIQGVVEMMEETSDIETRKHLKSKPVWDTALELINFLYANKTRSTSPNDANEKYDAFVKIILALAKVDLPESYVELMKKVGRIRRPFQAQAITIVMLCRTLAVNFSSLDKSDINIEKFDSLEIAFNKTLNVLEGATKAVPDLKSFNLSDFKKHKTVLEFGLAEKLIRKSFRALDLVTEWEQKQTDLSNAVSKDEERLKALQGILSKGRGDPPAKIKVNVAIHEKLIDGRELYTTSVDGEITMRLSALRWSVAGVLAEDKKHAARTAGAFFVQSGGEWYKIPVHTNLQDIAGDGQEVDLKLVVD